MVPLPLNLRFSFFFMAGLLGSDLHLGSGLCIWFLVCSIMKFCRSGDGGKRFLPWAAVAS